MLNTHHNTHTNIIIIIISSLLDFVHSSFLFSIPENPSLTANSSGLPSNSPNQFSFFRMNVFLRWRLSNWYGNRLLSMICFDRMFGDCIDVWNRIEIGICRIVDYCSLSQRVLLTCMVFFSFIFSVFAVSLNTLAFTTFSIWSFHFYLLDMLIGW